MNAVRDALGRLGALESLRAVSIGNESIEGAGGPLVARSPINGSVTSRGLAIFFFDAHHCAKSVSDRWVES